MLQSVCNASITVQISLLLQFSTSVSYIGGYTNLALFVHSHFGELQGLSPHEHKNLFGKDGPFGTEVFFISRSA